MQIEVLRASVSAWPCSSNAITTTAAPCRRTIRAWRTNSSSPSLSEIELTIDLPWMHFRPASITLNFEESTITGTLAMSGSAATRLRKVVIACFGIEQALVHVDVDHLGAVLDLVAGDGERGGIIAGGDELAEAGGAGDVGALADIDEGNVGGKHERLEAGEAKRAWPCGRLARRLAAHGFGDRADVGGRRAAAAADDVDEAGVGELGEQPRHVFRALVIEAELVGQAGIGIGADERIGDAREIGDVGAHLLRAERAVEPDRERRGVLDRDPERLRGLAREHAPGKIGDGAGYHDRHRRAARLEQLGDGVERGLGVEGVEDRLEQQQVGAAFDEALGLLAIGFAQLVEGDGAEAGIADVGRDRRGAVGRAHGAGDEARPAVLARRDRGGLLGEAGAGEVELGDELLRAVVGLGDPRRGEGVGRDDVGAGAEVVEVELPHGVRLRQDQNVVVAAQVARPVGEALPAIAGLAELEVLDFRAHGAVEHEDRLGGAGTQLRLDGRRFWRCRCSHAACSTGAARTPSRWQMA